MNLYDLYNKSKQSLLEHALDIDRKQVEIERAVSKTFGLREFHTGYTYLRHKTVLEEEMATLSLDQIDIIEKDWQPFVNVYPSLYFESIIDRTPICIIPLKALVNPEAWFKELEGEATYYFKKDKEKHIQNELNGNV